MIRQDALVCLFAVPRRAGDLWSPRIGGGNKIGSYPGASKNFNSKELLWPLAKILTQDKFVRLYIEHLNYCKRSSNMSLD